MVLRDEGCDLAAVLTAYPAASMSPDLRRDHGPGSVDHLHHHTPVTLSDHPTTRAASKVIAGLYDENQTTGTSSDSDQMGALHADKQITTIKRRRAAGTVRHRPRSLTTTRVELRSSSRTSTSTRNPRPTPSHPHPIMKSPNILLNTHQPTCEHICPNSCISNNFRLEPQSHLCAS